MNSQQDRLAKQVLIQKSFESKRLFLTILRFAIPTFFFALFSAAYVFVDQIMVIKFVPHGPLNPDSIFTDHALIEEFKASAFYKGGDIPNHTELTTSQLVKTVLNISQPIVVILNAITIFVPLGTGVIFSKTIGKGDEKKIKDAWNTGLVSTTLFALVTQIIVLAIAKEWLQFNLDKVDEQHHVQVADQFQHFFNEKAVAIGSEYVYILIGFNIIPMLSRLFFYLGQSEGRQLFIAIVPPLSNLLNVLFVFLLVRFSTLGVVGSAVAAILVYFITFMAYVVYLISLNKRGLTYLSLRDFSFKRVSFNLFLVISMVGLASFFRNGSLSILNTFYESFLVNLTKTLTDQSDTFYLVLLTGPIAIANLTSAAIFGVLQGVRTVVSYKFGQGQLADIKRINVYTLLVCLVFAALLYLILAVGLGKEILVHLFDTSAATLMLANQFSLIVQAQVFFVAIGATSQQYFQNNNRVLYSWIVSLMQGVIVFVPLLFIFQAITLQTKNIEIFIWLLTANAALAGLINVLIGQVHIHFFMDKYFAQKHKSRIVQFIERYS